MAVKKKSPKRVETRGRPRSGKDLSTLRKEQDARRIKIIERITTTHPDEAEEYQGYMALLMTHHETARDAILSAVKDKALALSKKLK